jgi:hypothetical protein
MCAKPAHPAIPGVILVVVLTLMVLTPFAIEQVDKVELRAMHTERLIRAYNALVERPDNVAATFEICRGLYTHGMKGNAIAIASMTMEKLSRHVDPVQNRSLRDRFREEEFMVKKWTRETAKTPNELRAIPCPGCGHMNPMNLLVCEKCGRPYLLDIAHKMNHKPRVYGRIVVAFAAIASLIVLCAAIGLVFQGIVLFLVLAAAIGATGGVVHWLFRAPKPR